MSKRVVVIGAGSGGLTVAIGCAKLGFDVTIIEKNKIGGDCTNYGCIPSKSLLFHSKELYKTAVKMSEYSSQEWFQKWFGSESVAALQKTRDTVAEFQSKETPEWLTGLGIKFVEGRAEFMSPTQVIVEGQIIEFDKCVVATGSHPVVPSIEGLDGVQYYTNENIFELEKPPSKLVILGAGVIGLEMAEAFANLGSEVVVLGRSGQVLKGQDQELANMLKSELENKGVQFMFGETQKVETRGGKKYIYVMGQEEAIVTDEIMVAVGRQPNVTMELEKANVKYTKRGIKANNSCKAEKNIYAVGDCVEGAPQFTHFANHMGSVVVTNLALQKYTRLPFDLNRNKKNKNPSVVFSTLELASVGQTEEVAKKRGGYKVYKTDLGGTDRGQIESSEGMIKLITKGPLGKIVGVHILHENAGLILPEFQRLIGKNMISLLSIIRPYPTHTFGVDAMAKKFLAEIVTKKKK